MKEILPVNYSNITHSRRTNNLSNLLSQINGNIEEMVNIINNNTTNRDRKNIFGVSRKITALDLAKFIKQSNSSLHMKKMQGIADIINNNKRSFKTIFTLGSKLVTAKELTSMSDGYTIHKNNITTKNTCISGSLNTMPLCRGNVVSLNEVGEK